MEDRHPEDARRHAGHDRTCARRLGRALSRLAPRALALGLLTIGLSACGTESPVAPTPVFPNLVAAWGGTATIGVSLNGQNGSNVCATTWIVNTQAADTFTGTFQLTGGSVVPCAQSGTFSGSVTLAGAVSATFGGGAPPSGCSIQSQTPLTGVASSTSMTLQQTIQLTCGGTPATQSVTLALTKR